MGLFSKKTKTTTNQNTSMTTNPLNPQWVTDTFSGLNDKINTTFNGLDPTKMVAGPNALQTQAAGSAGALGTPSQYGQAGDIFGKVAAAGPQSMTAASSLDGLEKYMTPFLKDVVDTSLADYDFGAGMTQAQNKLALAGDSTFGGSGGSIQTALSNDAINRGRGSLSAGLRSDAFNTGLAASQADAALRQQASLSNAQFGESALARQLAAGGAIGDLGTAQGNNDRANIGVQAGIGNDLRTIQNEQNQAPINLLLQQIAASSGLPLDLFQGQTSTGTMTGTSKSKASKGFSWNPTDGLSFG